MFFPLLYSFLWSRWGWGSVGGDQAVMLVQYLGYTGAT